MNELFLSKYLGEDFENIESKFGGSSSDIARAVARRNIMGIRKGDTVAMKSPKTKDQKSIMRFIREKNILERLSEQKNEYIIDYYGCIETPSKLPILILEWADQNLDDLISNEYPTGVPLGLMDRIIERVCKGLSALHNLEGEGGEGYLHRDIKPSNVLIVNKGLSKLGDLGSAGISTDNPFLGKSGSSYGAHGTDNYNAPECLKTQRGKKRAYSIKSDIYSIGLIAFYLIAGETPFDRAGIEHVEDFYNAKMQVCNNKIGNKYENFLDRSITEMFAGKNVPENKVKAIRRAIDGNPVNRHQSIDEFLKEFQVQIIPSVTDPLKDLYLSIKGLLEEKKDDSHGATRIEIVDSILKAYERMQGHKKTPSFEEAKKDIEQRVGEDRTVLKNYLGEHSSFVKSLPKEEDKRVLALTPIYHLVRVWGNGWKNKEGEEIFTNEKRVELKDVYSLKFKG